MKQQAGVVIALVKDLKDPDGQGRIRVEFPWLSEKNKSAWAPLAVPLAGKKRGMYFMPEKGDEALVAFEHGDFDHPYIIGFLWNGSDVPPDENINTSVRRLWTVSGHIMDFDDRDGQQAITLTTQGGQKIEMKDNTASIAISLKQGGHHIDLKEAEGTILIKTKNGQQIELNDQGKITLQVVSGNKVTIDASGITVQAAAGVLNVNCASANINATGAMNIQATGAVSVQATGAMSLTAASALNVTAPIANFSGIVRANVVQASAVISTAYTPGIGNLFGL
jgi:uncharacterized protein involved in type VI secretion and phage assembly